MRAILLIVILVPLLAAAVFRPLIGIYGYVWYALLRPDLLAYMEGAPYSNYLAIATLVGMIRQLPSFWFVLTNPISIALIALQVPLILSNWFEDIASPYSASLLDRFLKMILMCLLIPALVTTARQLWWLLLIMGGSLGFLGVKFGLFGFLVGGAIFRQGYGGLLSDNNDIALAFGMTIPLLWCLRRDVETVLWKAAMLFAVVMLFAGIVMTHSRGGSVTLLAVLLVLTLRSKRKFAMVLFLAMAIGPAIYLVRDSYLARMETLENPTEEGSAMSRIQLAQMAIQTWKQHPFLGVGFGGRASQQVLDPSNDQTGSVVHNTYLQMLADSGIFAIVIYLGLLWGTILWLEFSRRETRRILPHLANIPEAIQVALIGFAIGGTFLSRIQFDFTYMLLMAAASWWAVCRNEKKALAAGQPAAPDPAFALENA